MPSPLLAGAPPRARTRSARVRRDALTLPDLTALVRGIAADTGLWRPLVRVPDPGADRWWTRLATDSHLDVWLLTWLPGHTTDLHDHGRSAAAFAVVEGRLDEVRLDGGTRRTHAHAPGSVTWLAPGVVHDVNGAGDVPAVSIHAYSPPLRTMTYYRAVPGGVEPVRTVVTDEPEQAR